MTFSGQAVSKCRFPLSDSINQADPEPTQKEPLRLASASLKTYNSNLP